MKKIILLFVALAGIISLQSCEVNEINDQHVFEAEVFEFSASFNNNQFSVIGNFSRDILPSDHLLIYRLYGRDNGLDVWRLIPQTVYLENGREFDYNYDFTKRDFRIFMEPNFDLNSLNNQYWNTYVVNQIFRIVVVPGRLRNKMNYNDYDTTVRILGIENIPIKKLK